MQAAISGGATDSWRTERRVATQAALLKYTDRLHRARGRDDVLNASLDAIGDALECERASILLFDEESVMRFVAWRGLSDDYRAVAEGHSPWTAGQEAAEPMTVEDAREADFDDALKKQLEAEGIKSLAFIPLLSSNGVTGKFMMYFAEPHFYAPEEVDLALSIARNLEFALARVQAEAQLRESEARYRMMAHDSQLLSAIVMSSDDAIISKNLNGVIRSWNEGAQRLFGYAADEAIGRTVEMLFPPGRENEEAHIIQRIRAGERVENFDTVRMHKDGRLIDVSLTISPIRTPEGAVIGASKIARDITGRKRMEARLKRSEEEFRSMAENISQLAWMTDEQGWIYWYNKRWFDYTGTTLEEMQGWGWQAVHHPDHVDRVTEKFKHHLEVGEAWEDTFPLRGADGEYRWYLSRAMPIVDEDGAVLRWFGTNTDITEQKRAEEQRTLLINELNHRVKNTLATVQSLASQTLGNAADFQSARRQFEGRLQALARAHDTLTAQSWKGATMMKTIERAIEPFNESNRISVEGPDVWLTPKQTLAFALALHELATNAIKYGALSSKTGSVKIAWELVDQDDEAEQMLEMNWREEGGPQVASPENSGFGTRLIGRGVGRDLGADAELEFRPEGVRAKLRSPLEQLSSPAFAGTIFGDGA